MTGNAALEELRAMKRPSRRKLDALKAKHEGTPAWTRTAKALHAHLVQDGGFFPSVARQASVAQMASRQASVAQMAVRGTPARINEHAPGRFDQTRRLLNQTVARPYDQTRRFAQPAMLRPEPPVGRDPCPSLDGAKEVAKQLLMEASRQRESDNGCQQVLASIIAVAGLKMVVDNVYTDAEVAKSAATEIDDALKLMGKHYDVPVVCAVADSWAGVLKSAGLAVTVKCMGADATVATAVGQYL